MNLSRDDARKALDEIGEARGRVNRTHNYADASPFLILWGVIWLANVVTFFRPALSDYVWPIGIAAGVVITAWLGVVQARRRGARIRQAGGDPTKIFGVRFGLTNGAIMLFFIAMVIVASPDARQLNAFISLFWTFAYMIAGIWIGWRLAVIGAAASAAILIGYLTLDQAYFLVVGLAGGGSLILGGLWLRRI